MMYIFIYIYRKSLPGKFFELNIHYGLFVGDNKNKNNTDIFFGHLEKFRGCISDVSKMYLNYIIIKLFLILSTGLLQNVFWFVK